ncbi:MAG TPA: hypothetical protein VGO50_03810 [Pyrinomonadaceae bacterium]|jgi:hypothetical protein|nr:hypothetical protein [Pyrinomonadaceae bacterium]
MKKLTFLFTALLVLGLVIGAFALSGSSAVVTKADCCCKDSCPMKSKDKSADTDKHSCCCDGGSCCKDGACPMKGKDASGSEHASGECSCCGDSCPMKSKDKTASSNKGDKKDCCEGKESCPMKKKENG